MKAREVVVGGSRWVVGNGESINVWKDRWIRILNTFKVLSVALSSQERMKVKELIDLVTLSWRFDVLSALFLEEDVSMIRSMPISFRLLTNSLIWHFHNLGLYTVKSGYNVARKLVQSPTLSASTSNSGGNSYTKLWKFVWKAKYLRR